MSVELVRQSTHICNINTTLSNDTPPLQDNTLTLLFNSLEKHNKTWGPRSLEQCLRGDQHLDACVKDLTKDDLNTYARKVQTVFLQKVFAQNWDKPFMPDLIKTIPTDALEAFRFLLTLPNKKRLTFNDKSDCTNDKTLFSACKKTKDVALSIDALDAVLKTKDPELVATAFTKLPGDSGKVAKAFLERMHNALFIAPTKTDEDRKVSRKLLELLGTNVSNRHQNTWKHFTRLFEEYHRISYQQDEPIFLSAFSTTEKKTLSLDAESGLYDSVCGLLKSNDPEIFWSKTPDSQKKEYAASFACLFLRLRLTSTNETQLQAYRNITKDFTDKIVKDLDKEMKTSINLILEADTLPYKFASPIARAERSRLAKQLNAQGPKLAYSTSKEDAVEAADLYVHLSKLNAARKLDETWKAIPAEIKKEFAITFAALLAALDKSKKPIDPLLKDFYKTTVPLLDPETQKWIQGIIPDPAT